MAATWSDIVREPYETRAGTRAERASFDQLAQQLTAQSGKGPMSGESLGELTDEELSRWGRAQALHASAEAHKRAAAADAARADTEMRMLYYEISDRLGIVEDVYSVIDPVAGLMRRAQRAPAAAPDPRLSVKR